MKNLLIVDDDADLSSLLVEAFEMHYVNVHTCNDAQCVFEKVEQVDIDIMVLDYNLPSMTGLEIAEKVIELGQHPVIIMITAYSDQVMREKARELDIIGFLEKPFDIRVLDYYVTKCLTQ